VNTPKWRIKASYAAREALRYHLVESKARGVLVKAGTSAGASGTTTVIAKR
jgi:hypothetical protein